MSTSPFQCRVHGSCLHLCNLLSVNTRCQRFLADVTVQTANCCFLYVFPVVQRRLMESVFSTSVEWQPYASYSTLLAHHTVPDEPSASQFQASGMYDIVLNERHLAQPVNSLVSANRGALPHRDTSCRSGAVCQQAVCVQFCVDPMACTAGEECF